MAMRACRGASVLELLVVVLLVGMATLVAAPSVAHLRSEARCAAGARVLAGVLQGERWASVALRKHRGVYFERDVEGWRYRIVEDGNRNGLRSAEIDRGVDRTVSGPRRLEHDVEGVRVGIPPTGVPEVPPGAATLAPGDDPVRFGRSDLVSFSPLGRSSSGTVYLTDGAGTAYAVVLFGPTVRVRVWRWDARAGRWAL